MKTCHFDRGESCGALSERLCKASGCPFRVTAEELLKRRSRAMDRAKEKGYYAQGVYEPRG